MCVGVTGSNIQNTNMKGDLKVALYLFVVQEKREFILCDDNNVFVVSFFFFLSFT